MKATLFSRPALRALLPAVLGVLVLLGSCSHIADDEQLIYVPPVEVPAAADTLSSVPRAVLIEDFTGQRCVNCPDAAREIERLKAQYGDSMVVAVGIHSGPLAVYTTPTALGLRTAEGDAYYDYWRIDREPLGYVNRTGTIATHDQWATLVRAALQQPATLSLHLDCSYDEAARLLTVTLTARALQPFSGKLQLWLTESAITALQMMPDGSVSRDYVHNHVYRAAVNGLWGEDLNLAKGQQLTITHTAGVAADWQPARLAAVAFAYNGQGVAQVTEKPLF